MADPLSPARMCEGCQQEYPANTIGWYVDPEGIELCPECADDLFVDWKAAGLASADQVRNG